MLKELSVNEKGKDYFVGDIHGCYTMLMNSLAALKFDRTKDRLISVGDLVDRGVYSQKCLELISEPWFYAVLGNHEAMMIGCYSGTWSASNYERNGGEWFLEMNHQEQSRVVALANQLPIFLQVPVKGKKIGVVHADYTKERWVTPTDTVTSSTYQTAIWGRTRIFNRDTTPVGGVDLVVCGHTPVKNITKLGNILYIDTGAVYGGGLTILTDEQVLSHIEDNNANFT